MFTLIPRANRLLDGTDAEARKAALSALGGARSLHEAVTRAGLLDQLDEAVREEARSALAALPVGLDAAIRAVLGSALERALPAVIQWKPGSATELQVWEAVEGDVGQVGILITTPYGRDLGAGR